MVYLGSCLAIVSHGYNPGSLRRVWAKELTCTCGGCWRLRSLGVNPAPRFTPIVTPGSAVSGPLHNAGRQFPVQSHGTETQCTPRNSGTKSLGNALHRPAVYGPMVRAVKRGYRSTNRQMQPSISKMRRLVKREMFSPNCPNIPGNCAGPQPRKGQVGMSNTSRLTIRLDLSSTKRDVQKGRPAPQPIRLRRRSRIRLASTSPREGRAVAPTQPRPHCQ
jgi:hypothetical protein